MARDFPARPRGPGWFCAPAARVVRTLACLLLALLPWGMTFAQLPPADLPQQPSPVPPDSPLPPAPSPAAPPTGLARWLNPDRKSVV